MANKILLVFIILNFLFVACGGLLLAVVLMTRNSAQAAPTISNVAQNLLLDHCPLIGKISYRRAFVYMLTVSLFAAAGINAIFIFATFILSIPAMASTTRRTILRCHGYAVVFCAVFSMLIGLVIWFETLKTQSNMAALWAQ